MSINYRHLNNDNNTNEIGESNYIFNFIIH